MKIRFSYFLFVLFLLEGKTYSQNLIPNPSFELCRPQCSLNDNNNTFDIDNWQRPNANTSDLYSTLLPSTCQMYMPGTANFYNGFLGEQLPRTGNVLGGFINEGRLWSPRDTVYGYPHPYREYFSVALSNPLQIGKTYCASLYVSLPGNNDHLSNNIGMYFSDTAVTTNNYKAIYTTPQIIEKKIIADTLNWTLVAGCFVADKAFTHLTIGNFLSMDSTLFLYRPARYTAMNYFISYFFIDDVSVKEFIAHPLITMPDTSICKGSSVKLMATGPDYIWWSTSSQPYDTLAIGNVLVVSPDSSTTYLVNGFDCKCSVEQKTINVSVYPLSHLSLGPDTTVCENSYTNLLLPVGFASPYWNDGSQSNIFSVNNIGSYWLTASDAYGCRYSDTIAIKEIIPLPQVDLGPDFLFCAPSVLKADPKYSLYTWQNQNSTSSVYPIDKPGEYTLSITNECGLASDTLEVYAMQNIFVPNLITPNHDGMNDFFKVKGVPDQQNGELKVYNNWGNMVYEDDSYTNSWSGEGLSGGIYYYFYTFNCFESKGWVQIVK